MRFYVSWYPGDPVYPKYDPNCAILISVSSVAAYWTLLDLEYLPQSVIIDSGGYRYSLAGATPPSPQKLFERQLEMLEKTTCQATICALDYPGFSRELTSNDLDRRLHKTIANAYELKLLSERYGLPSHVKTMAIVQGYDIPSLTYCARELSAMEFDRYGIGSLAFLNDRAKVINRVSEVTRIVGDRLHVFGVTAGRMLDALTQLEIGSIDSSTPAKAAMYNQVFYSYPFRRYEIAGTRRKRQRSELIVEPLPCDCPVCQGNSNVNLLKTGKRKYVYLRTLHNYFHLKQTIMDVVERNAIDERNMDSCR